jgi:hypothetical protein
VWLSAFDGKQPRQCKSHAGHADCRFSEALSSSCRSMIVRLIVKLCVLPFPTLPNAARRLSPISTCHSASLHAPAVSPPPVPSWKHFSSHRMTQGGALPVFGLLSCSVHFVMCLSQPIKSMLLPFFPLPLTSYLSGLSCSQLM